MAFQQSYIVLAFVAILAIPSLALPSPVVQPSDITFSASVDLSASINVAYSDGSKILMDHTSPCSETGSWYRSTTSSLGTSSYNNEYLLEYSKDSAISGWTSFDQCIPPLGGFTHDNGFFYCNLSWINSHEYRTGPVFYNSNPVCSSTLASGFFLNLPSGSRPNSLRFLTGASLKNSGNSPSSYTVTWKYTDSTSSEQIVTVNGINISARNGAGNGWNIYAGLTFSTSCSSSGQSYLDEVIIANQYPAKTLQSVKISYTAGELRGPVAVAFQINKNEYDATYVYGATYQSIAMRPDEDANTIIWYRVDLTQLVYDASYNEYYGDIDLTVECGDGETVWEVVASSLPVRTNGDIGPIMLTSCQGQYLRYTINIESFLGVSPKVEEMKFYYVNLALFTEQWLAADCVSPEWCSGADLNHSGKVDFIDFAVFAKQWLQGF
jgi:hypothetical protein